MLDLVSDPLRRDRVMTRRDSLRVGMLGLGGLGVGGLVLSDLLRMRAEAAAAGQPKRPTSVILLFVHGGPSHLETYDLKPNAPAEIRGPYRPIATSAPGIEICENLPKQAKVAHRFSIIRSCCHDQSNHFEGHTRFLSGYREMKSGTAESHHPMLGSVVNRFHEGRVPGLPTAVAINGVCLNGPDYSPGIAQGFWPGQYRVPIVNGGMRDTSLVVKEPRLEDRRTLLKQFDGMRRRLDSSGAMDAMDSFNRQAIEIMTTDKTRKAFDLTLEDTATRERYGSGFGTEALLARRLVEAGVSFVSVRVPGHSPHSTASDWDDHAVNWDMLNAMNGRLPRYDHVVSTLINDIYDRGLDRDVLLVVTGEFGRTPRIEYRDGKIGRDHYPGAMSILVAGGGVPTGQVIGATSNFGAHPIDRKLDPHDILATIYHHLGIDHKREYADPQGRPFPLTHGTPIKELVG